MRWNWWHTHSKCLEGNVTFRFGLSTTNVFRPLMDSFFSYHSLCITQNDERNPFVISSINFRKMSVQIFTKNHIEFFHLCANLLLYLSWQRILLLIMLPLPLLYMNCMLSWPLSGASMEKVDSIKFNCAPHDTFHHRVHSFIYILLI